MRGCINQIRRPPGATRRRGTSWLTGFLLVLLIQISSILESWDSWDLCVHELSLTVFFHAPKTSTFAPSGVISSRPGGSQKRKKLMTFGHFWGVPQKVLPSLLCSCFVQNHHACGQKWPTAALLSRMLLGLAPPPSGKKLQKPYCFLTFLGPTNQTPQQINQQPTNQQPTNQHPPYNILWSGPCWPGLVWPWSGLELVLVLVWLWSGPGLALVWSWSGSWSGARSTQQTNSNASDYTLCELYLVRLRWPRMGPHANLVYIYIYIYVYIY